MLRKTHDSLKVLSPLNTLRVRSNWRNGLPQVPVKSNLASVFFTGTLFALWGQAAPTAWSSPLLSYLFSPIFLTYSCKV